MVRTGIANPPDHNLVESRCLCRTRGNRGHFKLRQQTSRGESAVLNYYQEHSDSSELIHTCLLTCVDLPNHFKKAMVASITTTRLYKLIPTTPTKPPRKKATSPAEWNAFNPT